jgi:glycosyltransferase involved in cell wall biosynthesis
MVPCEIAPTVTWLAKNRAARKDECDMRITFVLPAVTMDGGVRVVAIYAEGLKKRGHEVSVVAPPIHIPVRRKLKSFVLGRGWPSARWEDAYFAAADRKPHILESFRPVMDADVPDGDVVLATSWHTAYWVRPLSPAKGAKAFFIQGYEVPAGERNPVLDATWRMPMHKITISNSLVRFAQERFGDTVVSHVPNSVDVEQFNAAPRQKQVVPTIGLLYRKTWQKGCGVSLAAVKMLAARLPRLRLVSFGDDHPGPFSLRLPSYSEFHFRPPQGKLKELYSRCDVWLCGSNWEGFHLPPLEAMACRCPVVSTRVGGPLDIIEEGVNGHLVEIGDSGALSARLLRVLNLPQEEWQRMSDAAYLTATRYTWDEATDLFEKALQLTIERNKRGELRDEGTLRA